MTIKTIKIEIVFSKNAKLINYLAHLSNLAVKDHLMLIEINKIRASRNIKSLNNKNEIDTTNKTYLDILNNFDKRGYLVPSIEIVDNKAKLPSNS